MYTRVCLLITDVFTILVEGNGLELVVDAWCFAIEYSGVQIFSGTRVFT